jgi:phosphohistidine phosphatase
MNRRELLILRHAKSAWDADAPADFDRPLALRGMRAAKRMGRYIAETGLVPDAIVCSTATRAVQTVLGVAQAARFTLRTVRFEAAIYEAGLPALLDVLGDSSPDAHRTMIVGHNPGLEFLLDHLAGGVPVPGDGKLLPTAALARVNLPGDWRRLERGQGELIGLVRVRDLDD